MLSVTALVIVMASSMVVGQTPKAEIPKEVLKSLEYFITPRNSTSAPGPSWMSALTRCHHTGRLQPPCVCHQLQLVVNVAVRVLRHRLAPHRPDVPQMMCTPTPS
jgi:hypothetical protein